MQATTHSRPTQHPTSILLRGGTVLQHGPDDSVQQIDADVLILGDRISRIQPGLRPVDSSTKIIDCCDKIVTPGFIDTHRHMWQTQLKGLHGDHNLAEYIRTGHLTGSFYSPEDVYLGTLGGGAESIDAGTTTVVDHSHVALSPSHVHRAIDGLVASGLRAIFCPVPTVQVESWSPMIKTKDIVIPEWFSPLLKTLAANMPIAHGRVHLGLGFDGFKLPREDIMGLYHLARSLDIQLFTSHHFRGPLVFDAINPLAEYGLLGPNVLISHATEMTESEKTKILAAGAFISSTPSTELQMGLGEPVCLQEEFLGVSSLGVDCHSATSAFLVNEARLILQHARANRIRHDDITLKENSGLFAPIKDSVLDVFNLMTVKGARAIGMGDRVGRIQEGMLADLVVWDGKSTTMLAASQRDPIAAIILHSSPRDVETVIVNGVLRKHEGKLLPFQMNEDEQSEWKTIAQDILDSKSRLEKQIRSAIGDFSI